MVLTISSGVIGYGALPATASAKCSISTSSESTLGSSLRSVLPPDKRVMHSVSPSASAERHRRIILGVATVLVALPLLGLGWQLFRTPPPVPPIGSTLGMVSMDQSLVQLVQKGLVDLKDALAKGVKKDGSEMEAIADLTPEQVLGEIVTIEAG